MNETEESRLTICLGDANIQARDAASNAVVSGSRKLAHLPPPLSYPANNIHCSDKIIRSRNRKWVASRHSSLETLLSADFVIQPTGPTVVT